MTFKEENLREQLAQSPTKLIEIAQLFGSLSRKLKIEPVVTRVWDEIEGDSGVHGQKRAIDFRDETRDESGKSHYLYSEEDVNYLTSIINDKYPRKDGKLVCIHHSFKGGPMHFHLQIPAAWAP